MRKLVSISLCAALLASAAPIDPREEAFIGNRRAYWAFQKVVRPPVPAATPNPIDAFIHEGLKTKKLTPSPEADKRTLIRRATIDLTGLPPTKAEVDNFLADTANNAYDKLIARLQATPAYGERWALKWLDVVRYADTNGYELDAERPQAWRYRDYVIQAFQQNKPYDRFVKEQIAGDELYPGQDAPLIATGFLRAGPRHVVGGNIDEEISRQEVLLEMTLGVSNTFLGLTVGCARCHNHKFDPITQADHFRIQAIMAATDLKEIQIAPKEAQTQYEAAKKAHEARLKPIQDEIAAIEKPVREQLREAKKKLLAKDLAAALDIPKEKRTPEQELLFKDASKQIGVSWDEVVNAIPAAPKARRAALRAQMHAINLDEPEPPATAFAVANMDNAPQTHILKLGEPKHKIAPVEPAFLSVLGAIEAPKSAAGRRAAFANWLADPEHPLTARVMVNRIWQFRMGTGIVPTPNDFGQLGGRPSNRPLLDWLAAEFVASGWNIQHIDKLIVTSATYRQTTKIDEAKAAIDGDNKFYWRMNQRRMEGEALRDAVLQASGKLNTKAFGPPIKTPIEQEIYDIIFTEAEPDNLWPLPKDRSEIYRKSIYLLNKRTVRLPMLTNFDQPDAISSCPIRAVSTHALQALSLLNSDFMHEQSQSLAARVDEKCKGNLDCQLQTAYNLTLQRPPRPEEQQLARQYLTQKSLPLEDFCKALLNRHEFVYIP
jgi:hypothetical protein